MTWWMLIMLALIGVQLWLLQLQGNKTKKDLRKTKIMVLKLATALNHISRTYKEKE